MRWGVMLTRKIFLLVLASPAASAQESARVPPVEDFGYIEVRHDHLQWPTPESIARDLRSKDDNVRLQALRLIGFAEQHAHVAIWAQESAKVIGEAVVTPDQIELKYAAFGQGATQQAILAVEATQKQLTFAAVAVPKGQGWERIAVFECWCKYEMYHGQNALSESAYRAN